jgi:pimeloyl-ACP methyl ester carboxylesterase
VRSLQLRDGRRLSVRCWPGPDDRVLVVLHGLLDSSAGWEALRAHMRCSMVAFDLPGFGRSDPPLRGSIAGYARDVAEGLDRLGVERFTLVGHSLGGAIAAAVAELVPDNVAGVVLLAPAGFGRIYPAELWVLPGMRMLMEALLPWVLTSRIAVATAYQIMVTNGRPPNRETVDRVTRNGRALVPGTREAVRAVANAGRGRDAFSRRQVGYCGPVTAVWGDRDLVVPASHRKGLLAALPQARVQLWQGMGHHPPIERFEELVVLIMKAAAASAAERAAPARSDATRLRRAKAA